MNMRRNVATNDEKDEKKTLKIKTQQDLKFGWFFIELIILYLCCLKKNLASPLIQHLASRTQSNRLPMHDCTKLVLHGR